MIKVTVGGRGMSAIAAHLRYIAKVGRLPMEDDHGAEREGKEAFRAVADQWRFGGTCIPEVSERREEFNVMLSMPVCTDVRALQQAAPEFAKAELASHRYVMVLHTHRANPHVRISVRASSAGPRPTAVPAHSRWLDQSARANGLAGVARESVAVLAGGPRTRRFRMQNRSR